MTDHRFTRCPGCATVFRITAAQLALREGQVRCGQCRAVFDANDHLVQIAETPAGPWQATAAAVAEEPGVEGPRTRGAGGEAATEETKPEGATTEAATTAEATAAEATTEEAISAQAIIGEATTAEATTAEAITEQAITEQAITEQAITEQAITEQAITEQAITEGATTEQAITAEAITAEAIEGATTGEATTEEAISQEPATEEAATESADAVEAERMTTSETLVGDATAPRASSPPAIGSSDRFKWKPRRSVRESPRALYAIAVVLLVVAFALQAVLEYRDLLAAHAPFTRPALESACRLLGCMIEPLRDAAALSIDASDLQADPAHRGLLQLSATIRNRASYAIAYPYLELTLTDSSDQIVVRRAFPPADYAGGTVDPGAGIPPNGEKVVKLFIDASATAQAGYRLYLFYP